MTLGVAAHEALSLYSLFHLEQIGITIQVVKVLQQRKVQRLYDVRIRFALRQYGSEIHSQLLVCYRRLELGLIYGLEIGELVLLLLFNAPADGYLAPQIVVGAVAVELVAKPHSFIFSACHEYYAHLGVGVGIIFVV